MALFLKMYPRTSIGPPLFLLLSQHLPGAQRPLPRQGTGESAPVSYFGCGFRIGWKQQPAIPVPHRSQPFILHGNRKLTVCPFICLYIHCCSR